MGSLSIPVQLIQIVAKEGIRSHKASSDLLKAQAIDRLDINSTAINNTIPMSLDTIKCELILLSCYFVPCCLSQRYYKRFEDMSVGELNEGVGLGSLRKLWGMNTVPQLTRAVFSHLR